MTDARTAEEQFYRRYSWCLNPALSIEDLLRRYQEELERYPTLEGWQREESKTNLYLFACAVACTADDYFAQRWLNLSVLTGRFPRFSTPIALAQRLVDVSQAMITIRDSGAWTWRRRWDSCVANACRLLLAHPAAETERFEKLCEVSPGLLRVQLPKGLLARRMRLPEAFRNQDMAHHDVIALIHRFCLSSSANPGPTVLVGLRTAGAYFAALMAEYLKLQSWPDVSWLSIRPKNGLTRWEQQRLRRAARENSRILLVDDYPATGWTLRLALGILAQSGIQPERIAVLAPTHPAQPNWARLAGIDQRIAVFTIESAALYKNVWLASHGVESLCGGYYAPAGWEDASVMPDEEVGNLNDRLAEHSKDGHHVREKRVLSLRLSRAGETAVKRVLLKSVGWGWLGYHAYLAGRQLDGFVPRVMGLRHGLLVMEWIDGAPAERSGTNNGMVGVLASYVAARARRLPLKGDCRLDGSTYRWTGTDEILRILRAAYGRYLNRIKMPALRKELYKHVAGVPTLIDGNMRPDEWIHTPTGIYKADFEHHNFGGAEPDIVDPAYDLATAILEFGLSREDERELLRTYRVESGDGNVDERLLVHKILYGSRVMKHSLAKSLAGKDAKENNARYQAAMNFLVYSMNDFCAKLACCPPASSWSDRLFFLDLDGVFDQALLGFPHATQSGLQSLSLLRRHGFSVVLNTGRSVDHVRRYCEAYGLAGGIAEFGSVFVDAVGGRETPLIDSAGAEQLHRCREAVQHLPGVFIDSGYEYAIRAYRYEGRGFAGLRGDEIKNLLRDKGFSKLTYISRGMDSYIVQRHTGKGVALRFVRRQAGNATTPVTAIGDSNYDIGMLKAAEFSYAPANCSSAIRKLAREGQCRILKQRFQSGLLAAVRDRLHQGGIRPADEPFPAPAGADPNNTLMQNILKAADRHTMLQSVLTSNWWSL